MANVAFAPQKDGATEPTLPVTCIQKRADGTLFAWVVADDSTAHRQTLTIGQMTGNRIAISSGISRGQRVVTEGYQKLSEGNKVIY